MNSNQGKTYEYHTTDDNNSNWNVLSSETECESVHDSVSNVIVHSWPSTEEGNCGRYDTTSKNGPKSLACSETVCNIRASKSDCADGDTVRDPDCKETLGTIRSFCWIDRIEIMVTPISGSSPCEDCRIYVSVGSS